ncbi:hypothetical protein [Streptomyces sp. NPDC048496]|uniref:hypothetical protein n=1 Tax=Streptomyces sp. NPDC048496 TaxID=3365558 RepID=UPI003718D1B3
MTADRGRSRTRGAEPVGRTSVGDAGSALIEAAGRPGIVRSAYEAARRGDTVLPRRCRGMQDMVPINLLELFAGAKRIVPSGYGSDDVTRTYDRIINLLRIGRIDLEALVTHRMPLSEANEAIDLMRSGEALRVMLTNG